MEFEDDEGFQKPSYQIEPEENEKFRSSHVKEVVKEVMDTMLKDIVYNDEKSKELSLKISNDVKAKIKGVSLLLMIVYERLDPILFR